MLDRIDLHVEVSLLNKKIFLEDHQEQHEENSESVRQRVCLARTLQQQRQQKNNANLSNRDINAYCKLTECSRVLLTRAMENLNFSPRAYHRILKVARSIADLAQSEHIEEHHLAEAISFRALDRK